jgi:transposase
MTKECLVKKLDRLKELAKTEKESRYLDRIRSLIAVGEGPDIKEVARIFDVHWHTIKYRWLKQWNKGGYEALIDKPKSGRPQKLPSKYHKALREYVLSKDNRIVCKELSKFIKDRWDIDCDEETVRKILIKMKLSWHKPSKKNYKADQNRRKVFVRDAHRSTVWIIMKLARVNAVIIRALSHRYTCVYTHTHIHIYLCTCA